MQKTTSNSTTQGVIPTKSVTHMDKKTIAFSRIKRRFLKHVWVARIMSVIGVLLGIYLFLFLGGIIFEKVGFGNYFELASDFIFTPSSKIKSIDNRTNILIMGKSGKGHAGPDLTDSIIFASVSHKTSSISFVSLSRDIWIPAIRAKLNSAYYWGNQRQPGGGLILAKSTAEEIVGTPVQYGVVIDFSAFERIIDVLGGIKVDIERSFTDEKYPIAGRENDECGGDSQFRCRYETIHFEKGKQFMDGATALKFVRSRNAEADEGTDIAREARQQKVISAIKEKVLSPQTLFNPWKILMIWRVVRESVETDINGPAAAILIRRAIQGSKQTTSYVLPENFLENPPISPRYDNQYVFIPKAGDWSKVHEWVKSILH